MKIFVLHDGSHYLNAEYHVMNDLYFVHNQNWRHRSEKVATINIRNGLQRVSSR